MVGARPISRGWWHEVTGVLEFVSRGGWRNREKWF